MTENVRANLQMLDRLADAEIEEILRLSDDEVLAEFSESGQDLSHITNEYRALFAAACKNVFLNRLDEARKAVAADAKTFSQSLHLTADEVRRQVGLILATNSNRELTLAARKEKPSSDEDLESILQDFIELGLKCPTVNDD